MATTPSSSTTGTPGNTEKNGNQSGTEEKTGIDKNTGNRENGETGGKSPKEEKRRGTEKKGLDLDYEEFENIEVDPMDSDESLDIDAPEISMEKLTESILEAATSTERFHSLSDQMFVIASCIFRIDNILRFYVLCFKHGGVAFLIPYLFGILAVGAPMVYLESVFGQYTSLPPLQLFHRLGLAYTGIGLGTTFMSAVQMALEEVQMRSAALAAKCCGILIHNYHDKWLSCSFGLALNAHCYDLHRPPCQREEVQSYSECWKVYQANGSIRNSFTWEQVVNLLTNTSEALRRLPTQIYINEIVSPEPFPSDIVLASIMLFNALIFIVTIMGMRFFTKLARSLVISPLIMMSFMILIVFHKYGYENGFEAIAIVMEPEYHKLLSIRAWTDAVIHVMQALAVCDGGLIVISSMKKFDNNAMRDTFFIVGIELFSSALSILLCPPIIGAIAEKVFEDTHSLKNKMYFLMDDWRQFLYTLLPALFGMLDGGILFLTVLYFTLTFLTMGPQIITLEMVLMSIYRAFPRLMSISSRISRKFVCCAYISAMFVFVYLSNNHGKTDPFWEDTLTWLPLPIVALFEIIAMIHVYTMTRFVANMRTMLGEPPNRLWKYLGYPVGWYWSATLYVITPVTCLIIWILSFFDGRIHAIGQRRGGALRTALAYCSPLLIPGIMIASLVYKLVETHRSGQSLSNLFKTDFKWGPKVLMDRLRAVHEERAARIYT